MSISNVWTYEKQKKFLFSLELWLSYTVLRVIFYCLYAVMQYSTKTFFPCGAQKMPSCLPFTKNQKKPIMILHCYACGLCKFNSNFCFEPIGLFLELFVFVQIPYILLLIKMCFGIGWLRCINWWTQKCFNNILIVRFWNYQLYKQCF